MSGSGIGGSACLWGCEVGVAYLMSWLGSWKTRKMGPEDWYLSKSSQMLALNCFLSTLNVCPNW